MAIVYSAHAIERMNERGISLEEIEDVVRNPDGTNRQSRDKTIRHKTLARRRDNDIAAVVVEHVDGTLEVSTVMREFDPGKGRSR